VAAPAAGEAKLPQLSGGAVVMVDRLIAGEGVDLAGAGGRWPPIDQPPSRGADGRRRGWDRRLTVVLGRPVPATMTRMSLKKQSARALRGVAWRIDRPPKSRRRQPAPPHAPAPRDSAPGSRTATGFFDQFPRFYRTSSTAPQTARLNLRYEAIVGDNRDIFAGASVLDLASHDGRWSLAALATGARSVTGIEARPELVKGAAKNLAGYGYGPDRARFITGDVHRVLSTQDFDADVVLCLGFLYHTLRYNELLHGIRKSGARYLIIDTFSPYMMAPVPNVNVITEYGDQEGAAAPDAYTCGPSVLVGLPNLAALRTMLGAYGYQVERLSDWAGLLRDNPSTEDFGDYANQKRITIRCVSTKAAPA
jgi:SAM-dependent methyltransferase